MLMATRVSTHELPDYGSPGDTSALGMGHMAAHFLGLCAAGRHIAVESTPLDAPLALLMERMTAHFGLFPTNKPTIEPTRTREIDERTHRIDKRTRDSTNEPEVRLVAPTAPKPAPLLRVRRRGGGGGVAAGVGLEPKKGDSPERPQAPLDGEAF